MANDSTNISRPTILGKSKSKPAASASTSEKKKLKVRKLVLEEVMFTYVNTVNVLI